MKNSKRLILIILDGWGIGDGSASDLISNGSTPAIDALLKEFPNSQLLACGENVGLPEGQMGNSEVGHLNIGAGRVIYQDLVKINLAVKDKSIAKNPALMDAFSYAKAHKKAVHFIGLVSDGGVHSLHTHLYALCDQTADYHLPNVYVHALTDGRDTDPKSGLSFIKELEQHLKGSKVQLATLAGRYFTMDRDKRWDRIKIGYDLLVDGKGEKTTSIVETMESSYKNGVTDEFIKPIIKVDEKGLPVGTIKPGDVVICFNFRTDRLREITIALSQKKRPFGDEMGMPPLDLRYYTMTRYDDTFEDVHIIYDKENVGMTLGEVMEKNHKKQIRIAETEKYAHVTFFFSGGREEPFDGEKRILIQSPKVATYDLQPEMSAHQVKDAIIKELDNKETDFICLNFANGDMVGHTGFKEAILKAVQTVDTCVGEVIDAARKNGYQALIIADHGNADHAINEDGSPNTAHSLNPVPCLLVSEDVKSIKNGILADVAPTVLHLMGLEVPKEMTGQMLVE